MWRESNDPAVGAHKLFDTLIRKLVVGQMLQILEISHAWFSGIFDQRYHRAFERLFAMILQDDHFQVSYSYVGHYEALILLTGGGFMK